MATLGRMMYRPDTPGSDLLGFCWIHLHKELDTLICISYVQLNIKSNWSTEAPSMLFSTTETAAVV